MTHSLKFLVPLLASLMLGVAALPSSGYSRQATLPALKLQMQCTPQKVVPETNVPCVFAMKNVGGKALRQVRMTMSSADLIVHSSMPYKLQYRQIYKKDAANWLLKTFTPGSTFKVRLTLKFPLNFGQAGYSYAVEGQALRPFAFTSKIIDVYYKPTG